MDAIEREGRERRLAVVVFVAFLVVAAIAHFLGTALEPTTPQPTSSPVHTDAP